MHHHKIRKLNISAEETKMPPQDRTLSLTSFSQEGCKSVPITVSKQKKVTSLARPCHTEDGAMQRDASNPLGCKVRAGAFCQLLP